MLSQEEIKELLAQAAAAATQATDKHITNAEEENQSNTEAMTVTEFSDGEAEDEQHSDHDTTLENQITVVQQDTAADGQEMDDAVEEEMPAAESSQYSHEHEERHDTSQYTGHVEEDQRVEVL